MDRKIDVYLDRSVPPKFLITDILGRLYWSKWSMEGLFNASAFCWLNVLFILLAITSRSDSIPLLPIPGIGGDWESLFWRLVGGEISADRWACGLRECSGGVVCGVKSCAFSVDPTNKSNAKKKNKENEILRKSLTIGTPNQIKQFG